MLKVKVYNQEGKEVGEEKLNPAIFEISPKDEVIHQVVVAMQSNKRQVLAHTKVMGEVRGGGAKPWRQKGTGRARHGSTRSPIWRGGGVTFGPRKDRNWQKKINKKMKRKALFMILSDKAKNKKIILIDKLELPEIKTKKLAQIIQNLPAKKATVLALPKVEDKIVKSGKNISELSVVQANSINCLDLLKYEYLLMPVASLKTIESSFLKDN